MSDEAAAANEQKTKFKRYMDWAQNQSAISLALMAVIALTALFGLANAGYEFMERVGLLEPSPRAPVPQVPLGPIRAVQLTPAAERIEFPGTYVPVLKDGETEVVLFSYEGMDSIAGLDPNATVLVAEFSVWVNGRRLGAALDDYVSVKSIYDRASFQSGRTDALRVIEGDVLTVLQNHHFLVERVWHINPYNRGFGDDETQIYLVPIR